MSVFFSPLLSVQRFRSLTADSVDINGGTIDGITTLAMSNAAGPSLLDEAATSTNPTLIPNRADGDTGVGWQAANTLSLIAGGVEVVRMGTASSGVNFVTLTPAATGANQLVLVGAAGADSNVGLGLSTKGTGNVQIGSGLSAGANPSRKLQVQPDSAGKVAIGIQAAGSTSTEKALLDFIAGNGTGLAALGMGAATSETFRIDSILGIALAPGAATNGNGTIKIHCNTTGIGFFATSPAAKQEVTGVRDSNAALANLLTALATYGLITDSTTAT